MWFVVSFLFLFSCKGNPASPPKPPVAEICGRSAKPIYQARVPTHWIRKETQGDLKDTTQALCEFRIADKIRLTIHNFPNLSIPPQGQIARWKKQFEAIQEENVHSWVSAGFAGLFFEGVGSIKGDELTMWGWAMQIAKDHFHNLEDADQKADFTIKAIGPSDLMADHKQEIQNFAKSFELIEAIPTDP